jgi:excisionase family DNA binding protein
MSIEEAGQYIGVSRQTAYDEAAEGKWPTIWVRGRKRVVRKLFDEMIEAQARADWRGDPKK